MCPILWIFIKLLGQKAPAGRLRVPEVIYFIEILTFFDELLTQKAPAGRLRARGYIFLLNS